MKEKTFRQAKISLLAPVLLIDLPLVVVFFGAGFITLAIRWLRYKNSQLILKEKTVILQNGVLSKQSTEIPYSKINSVSIKQGIFGNIFGYGDIVIMAGNDTSGIPFSGVESPQQVRQLLNNKLS